MNSASLERWQVVRLLKRVDQELQFLVKREGRMHQKHFPMNGPVFEHVKSAREANWRFNCTGCFLPRSASRILGCGAYLNGLVPPQITVVMPLPLFSLRLTNICPLRPSGRLSVISPPTSIGISTTNSAVQLGWPSVDSWISIDPSNTICSPINTLACCTAMSTSEDVRIPEM
jgi:hypothetical protein